MKRLYTVYDTVAKEYGPLMSFKNDEVAKRVFENDVKSGRIPFYTNMQLNFIANFDEDSGKFKVPPYPQVIMDGSTLIEKEKETDEKAV